MKEQDKTFGRRGDLNEMEIVYLIKNSK